MKKIICMVLAVLMISSCLCSCDTDSAGQSSVTTKTTTYENFKANKSNSTTVYTDADIFAADAILGKAKDKDGNTIGASDYAYMSKIADWKYKEVAEGLVKESYRIGSAEFWQDASKILSGKFGELFSWKKDMYKTLLMDYLTYYGQSEEFESNFAKQTTKFSYEIYQKFLSNANSTYKSNFDEYLNSYKLEDAIKLSQKYGWIDTLSDFTTIVNDIATVSKTSLEYYQNLSKALALKEVNVSRINFLKKVKEVSSDEDLKKAVDEIVETIEGSYASIHFNEMENTMFNSSIEIGWNTFLAKWGKDVANGNATPGAVSFYKSLMAIKLGKSGLNWLFNSDNYSQCILELSIIYIMSVDVEEAYRQLMSEYQNNPSHESASNFVNGYLCCLNYQSYASTIADKYLMETFFEGAYNKLKNMFSNENSVSYEWMKTRIDTNKKMCVSCNRLVGTYYSAFNTLYGYDDTWLYTASSSYTWLVEPTIEADDIIVFDESYVPDKFISNGENDVTDDKGNIISLANRFTYAVIKRNGMYSFIDYSGNLISEDFYPQCYGCSSGKVALWNNSYGGANGGTIHNMLLTSSMKLIDDGVTLDRHYEINKYYYNVETKCFLQSLVDIENWRTGQEAEFYKVTADEITKQGYHVIRTVNFKGEPTIGSNEEITGIVKSLGKYAIINDGNLVTDFVYDDAINNLHDSSNIIACKRNGQWKYYYNDGAEVMKETFNDVYNVIDTGTTIKYDDGKPVNPTIIYNAYLPTYGYIAVNKDGGYGYYNTDGKEVIPCGEFEQARPVYNGKAWVKKNGKWGVIQLNNAEADNSKDNNDSGNSDVKSQINECAKTYNGHSYYVYSDVCDTWEEAKEYCEALGGHLAVINDASENKAIFDIMKELGYDSAYFGLTDSENEGTWKWVNNENSQYDNWSDGEPNNEGRDENYAMFYYKSPEYQWNDGDFGGNTVNGEKQFICEWDG